MEAFDFEKHPENIAVIVLITAGLLFFLCFYCTFVKPVFECFGHVFRCITMICCTRRMYSQIDQV